MKFNKNKKNKVSAEVKKLNEELARMTSDRDSSILMYRRFLESSVKRGKSVGILLPLIKQEEMEDLLSELYDLRVDIIKLKGRNKMLIWQKNNPGKGVRDYLLSLGDLN